MNFEPVRRAPTKAIAEPLSPAQIPPALPRVTQREAMEFRALRNLRTVVGSARNYNAEVKRHTGISGSQLWALSEISSAAGLSVNALAERLALHQTTASNLVNALVERGYIRRVRDGEDQRVVRLFATTEGNELLVHAPRPYAGLLIEALRNLPPDDLGRLTRSLAAMLGAMRRPTATTAGETLLGE